MRLVFHIGMGKTGSSTLQAALVASAETLAAQRAEYMGMWFDMLDPDYRGVLNQDRFFALPFDEMKKMAERLLQLLKARAAERDLDTFILSNEAFSGYASAMKPMLDHLQAAGVAVLAVGYARDPASWLPSAYVQWGVRDKVNEGPVPPYTEKARQLVGWYTGLMHWKRLFGDCVDVRSYDQADDIVQDFAEAIDLKLDVPKSRLLERGEDVEILLRALFNNRFPKHTLPGAFDRMVFRTSARAPSVDQMAQRCLNYDETGTIIEERDTLFRDFAALIGFDPRDAGKSPPKTQGMDALKARLFDCLVEISLDQALRIDRLEQRLKRLEGAAGAG